MAIVAVNWYIQIKKEIKKTVKRITVERFRTVIGREQGSNREAKNFEAVNNHGKYEIH